ncbi:MAG: arginine--tRNA ligase, partial [Verrucomicrobiota bacterium]
QENLEIWQKFIDYSRQAFEIIYKRLDIHFDHTLGESFYNPRLKGVVQDLLEKKIAERSEGAVVVYFKENEQLKDHPFLIEKSDGAALYATTDIATLEYRLAEFKPDRVIYVTDGRQQLHFKQLFAIAEQMNIKLKLEHVWFGAILGQDKKPLKTREGTPVKLKGLLDEAEKRATEILKQKRPDLEEQEVKEKAAVIGLGALKYADQAQNRNLDYVFNWEKLLAFDGNTAPYVLNAYVRTRSILRKAGKKTQEQTKLILQETLEVDLARKILEMDDIAMLVAREGRPHYLCQYLYELASLFHKFFENCPVLKADNEELKNSRLRMCDLTGGALRCGLELLGIQTLEEM